MYDMKKIWLPIGIIIVLVAAGAVIFIGNQDRKQDPADPTTSEKKPPEIQVIEFTPEKEIEIMKQSVAKANELQQRVDDPELFNWLVFTIGGVKTFELDFSDEEIIQKAKQEKQENERYIAYAKEQYGVSFSDEEIDQLVEEYFQLEGSELEKVQAFAGMLDMTVEEYMYEFERARNTQSLMWMELQPLLKEKYAEEFRKQTRVDRLNTFLLEKYKEEIERYYK